MAKNLNELNIKEAARGLRKGEFTSVDLTKACLNAIKEKDKSLNAFISITDKWALEQAKESDERFAKGSPLGELDGIPIAIKDNIATKGIKTTSGSRMLEDFIPVEDAFVVKRLKEAGAVIIGKTNMDEYAMGSSTESSYFGPAKNPKDTSRVPGGSSGGSAAAVASNETICALGSDTGGSIRQPAAFCGIVGFKPTYGAVSRNGLFAMASSLDQIGPMTKSVADTKALFEVILGHDPKDSTSSKEGTEILKKEGKKDIKELKIAVLKEGFGEGIDHELAKVVSKKLEVLKEKGAKVEEVSIPVLKYALPVYYILMPVEVSSNLSRYDGIKYGFSEVRSPRSEAQSLIDVYLKSREKGFGAEVKRRIMLGAYASSAGYIDQYYLKARKVAEKIKSEFDKIFEKYDAVISPTTPSVAFELGEKTDDPLKMYLEDILTVPANIAGLPAISLPAGEKDGLPVGIQVVGNKWSDMKVIQIAELIENLSQE